jgi:hypothetical protein
VNFHICSHVGVSGTTNVVTMKIQDGGNLGSRAIPEIWEARVGIAIMGHCAPTTTPDSNPFDRSFRDNFARGFGTTEEESTAALKLDMHRTADSLWAE